MNWQMETIYFDGGIFLGVYLRLKCRPSGPHILESERTIVQYLYRISLFEVPTTSSYSNIVSVGNNKQQPYLLSIGLSWKYLHFTHNFLTGVAGVFAE